VTEWESGQDAQGLVTPTDDEGDDKKDDKVSPPVSTDPVHDGKAHEYGHRNERHEALQMGVVQQPGGTHEQVKNNENPKQSIRYSRLIAHGSCLAFQSSYDHDTCDRRRDHSGDLAALNLGQPSPIRPVAHN
jgi:hypothetical protein